MPFGKVAWAYTFRDGLILHQKLYMSQSEANRSRGAVGARRSRRLLNLRDTARAMSENLDLVRSIYANWEQNNFDLSPWADPQIEYVIADGPHPGRWTGINAVVKARSEFLTTWAEWRVKVESYRELDAHRVLVLSHVTGRGKASGVQLEQPRAAVFDIAGGRVIRHVVYWDRDRALADLGLAE